MDRRYTDYDVRSNPNLKHLARRYLSQYSGNFQFLVECKHVMETGTLTNQQYRGVLNSMLADPMVKGMPTPVHTAFDAGSFSPPPRQTLELNLTARQQPRPTTISLPARWHYPFGISNHKQARVVHNVDLKRSHGILLVEPWTVTWIFYWQCAGYSMPTPYEKKLALFSLDDAVLLIQTGNASHIKHLTVGEPQRQWKWCAQCDGMNGRG